ncbi:major facilitator superfamily protein (plasmid) [Rhizobium sp. CIAT894]|uniref:MFS transporter n=1 Tax=Rhizobium sp. CIAT894 TaxID=2020312 RepID=UPI000A1D8747|nr:MFS transporter [Rhizobium sp. CIAT894]ARM90600.1 major facilitator superfamily protein [Rhizobium sp. CIAT894]
MTFVASDRAAATHIYHRSRGPEQWGTRAMYLAVGLAMAAWAPLVPFAKARTAINDGTLGLVLLCLGLGSLVVMPLTGLLANRFGCRAVLFASSLAVALILPMLALSNDAVTLAISLAIFGASLGTLDVATNIQAVMVEKDSGRNMMSGFYGIFSLGGILGAGGVSLLMHSGFEPLHATLVVSGAVVVLALASRRVLLSYGNREAEGAPLFVAPNGIVIVIGLLCFILFLAEGAILDWSALFMIEAHGLDPAVAGFGYATFAIAMTVGRLTGDGIVKAFGGTWILVVGSLVSAAGFVLAVFAPMRLLALAGFLLVGLGASNIVPVLYTAAGAQSRMPASLAIASVTTIGYTGILMGPAAIGGVAQISNLGTALLLIAAALAFVAVAGPRTLRR